MSNLPAVQDNDETSTHCLYMWKADSAMPYRPMYQDHGSNINGRGDNSNSTAEPNSQAGHGEEKRNNDMPVFSCFPNIPKEIRLNIWELVACGDPKTVDIWAHLKLGITSDELTWSQYVPEEYLKYMTLSQAKNVPPILHVCHEARTIGLKFYTPEVETKGAFNLPNNLDRVVTPRIWNRGFWHVASCGNGLETSSSRDGYIGLHHTDVNFIQQSNLIDYPGEIILYRFAEASFPKKVFGVPDSQPMSAYSLILSEPGILQSTRFWLTTRHVISNSLLHWMMNRKGDDWKRPNIELKVWGQPDCQLDLWDDTSPVRDYQTNEIGWTGLLSRLLQLNLTNCNLSKYHTTLSGFRHLPPTPPILQNHETAKYPNHNDTGVQVPLLPYASLYARSSIPSRLSSGNFRHSFVADLCRSPQPAQPVERSLEAADSTELHLGFLAGLEEHQSREQHEENAPKLITFTREQMGAMTREVYGMSREELIQHHDTKDLRSHVIARQVALLQWCEADDWLTKHLKENA
ncbi:hypothetical protein HYALB_00007597 [Hymenoscyphus albidus]|uniref:2EXR domain-containing protein n=1 Tax=Hymenoscyphus albidus TaxID=595503 RepID=A0A9N9LHA7_9HELO|nr:hypothetical protein HYALB_00007597 [Hymenoscyphus albidus]